jgi:hypothetical protein
LALLGISEIFQFPFNFLSFLPSQSPIFLPIQSRFWNSLRPQHKRCKASSEEAVRQGGSTMPKSIQSACHSLAMIATLASTVIGLSTEMALADKPSTPVEVTNPTTEPVPTTVVNPATQPALTRSVDDQGRIAYQEEHSDSCPVSASVIKPSQCNILFSTVPVGHRLVIQHVSFVLVSDFTLSYALAQLNLSNALSSFIAGGFEFTIAIDHPVLGYVDGGNLPSLAIFAHGVDTTATTTASIMGYLLDCTATPCNAIAP